MKWLVLALPLLSACTYNAVNVFVSVNPDASGELKLIRFRPADEAAKDLDGIDGIKQQKSQRFTIETYDAAFDNLNRVNILGIRFLFKSRSLVGVDTGFEATVQIPTTAQVPWFKKLGMTEAQLAAVEALVNKPRDQLKESEIPSIVFHIVMPGAIEKNQLQDIETPKGWILKSEHPNFPTKDKIVAVLVIPIRDILKGQVKEIDWKVLCGPVVPERKK